MKAWNGIATRHFPLPHKGDKAVLDFGFILCVAGKFLCQQLFLVFEPNNDHRRILDQPKGKSRPATTKPAINISPETATTPFWVVCFSLASRRFFKNGRLCAI